MAEKFYVKKNILPKGQGSSGRVTVSGGGSSVVNNTYITNNYTTIEQGGNVDVYKGRITIDDLLEIDTTDVKDDLYLCYHHFTEEEGWSTGNKYFLSPSHISCLRDSSSSDLFSFIVSDGDTIRVELEYEDDYNPTVTVELTDAEGTKIPGSTSFIQSRTFNMVADADAEFIKVTTSDRVKVSFYKQVNDETFVQLGYLPYKDFSGSYLSLRCWQPVNPTDDSLSSYLKVTPTPDKFSLISNTYPRTSYANLYGRYKPGLPIADVKTYNREGSTYKVEEYTQGNPGERYSGTTDTLTLCVPYARHYTSGGEEVYEPGCLTAADYEFLMNGGGGAGVDIDTAWPTSASHTHVPSTKLVKESAVFTTGDQTIRGRKTFSGSLIVQANTPSITYKVSDSRYAVMELRPGEDYTGVYVKTHDDAVGDTTAQIPTISQRGSSSKPIYINALGETRECNIASPNNPTVTIKQGSTTKGSFTLNQSTAAEITIDAVPTNVSAFTNDAGYVTSSHTHPYLPLSGGGTVTSAVNAVPVITVNNNDTLTNSAVSIGFARKGVEKSKIEWKDTLGRLQIVQSSTPHTIAYLDEIPTLVSAFTNDAGYLTQTALSPYLKIDGSNATKAGTAAQINKLDTVTGTNLSAANFVAQVNGTWYITDVASLAAYISPSYSGDEFNIPYLDSDGKLTTYETISYDPSHGLYTNDATFGSGDTHYSINIGNNTISNTQGDFTGCNTAIGSGNSVDSELAFAFGRSNEIHSQSNTPSTGSAAFGRNNKLYNSSNYAFGWSNTVSGATAFAFGGSNTASGQYGVALGSNCTASALHTRAIGLYALADHDHMTAIGKYTRGWTASCTATGHNTAGSDYLILAVGAGAGPNSRKNMFEVWSDGDVRINDSKVAKEPIKIQFSYQSSTNSYVGTQVGGTPITSYSLTYGTDTTGFTGFKFTYSAPSGIVGGNPSFNVNLTTSNNDGIVWAVVDPEVVSGSTLRFQTSWRYASNLNQDLDQLKGERRILITLFP